MSLFDAEPGAPVAAIDPTQPLAREMRPATLGESWARSSARRGVGPAPGDRGGPAALDDLLRPPGTGKTTLARGSRFHANAAFEELSAVEAGRKRSCAR